MSSNYPFYKVILFYLFFYGWKLASDTKAAYRKLRTKIYDLPFNVDAKWNRRQQMFNAWCAENNFEPTSAHRYLISLDNSRQGLFMAACQTNLKNGEPTRYYLVRFFYSADKDAIHTNRQEEITAEGYDLFIQTCHMRHHFD